LDVRQKMEVLPPEGLSAKNTASLTTLRGIRKEAGRVYRAVANGRLPSEEGTRRMFMLDKARVMLAAEQEAEPVPAAGPSVHTVNIITVPRGWFVTPLFGVEVPMPHEIIEQLRELLPVEAFTPVPDPSLPPPIDDALPVSTRPFLRVLDSEDDEREPPIPPAA